MTAEHPAANAVRLDQDDNVAVATRKLPRGEQVNLPDAEITARTDIAPGHKIAVRKIVAGTPVMKYGQPIGMATADIEPGDHVHIHNLADHHTVSDDLSGLAAPARPDKLARTFDGFHRADGRVDIKRDGFENFRLGHGGSSLSNSFSLVSQLTRDSTVRV